MQGLLSGNYPGKIYPINKNADKVFGIPAMNHIEEVVDPVDLAVLAIPEERLEEVIEACGRKNIKGAGIITAGFGETSATGKEREVALAQMARSYGLRLLGPNMSGTYNLHADFIASSVHSEDLICNNLAVVCQGGYAFHDLMASGSQRGLGVGKFVHTGNECDLTVTDFLEYFGHDSQVKAIIMYIETLRDGRRFIEVAREVSQEKPIVAYKAGRTPGAARAAQSHTGALSGSREIYEGVFNQSGVILSPNMEVILSLSHALVERPPMKGRRVGIVTMGGSWGVALSDTLEEAGLLIPEFSPDLQMSLRSLGMPDRASTRNPVDIGASGLFFEVDIMIEIGRRLLDSGEVDALILHGIGRPGRDEEGAVRRAKLFLDTNRRVLQGFHKLEEEKGLPVLLGSLHSQWESQVVHEINQEGIRIYNRLDEMAQILSLAFRFWRRTFGESR
jgi:acyl-CoA synthetase (NDP forming)